MNIKDFTTGVQHIGIPTNNIEETINFYLTLGFTTALRTINGTEEVAFLQLHNLVIETYQNRQAAMAYGAIDHIAIDVKNIDELFKVVQRAGLKMLDTVWSMVCRSGRTELSSSLSRDLTRRRLSSARSCRIVSLSKLKN